MATRVDIGTDLTLEIDGSAVTTEKFQRGVTAFFAMLADISRSVCAEKDRPEWLVQVKAGSNLVSVMPASGVSAEVAIAVIQAMAEGMAALEQSAAEPPHFDEHALKRLRDLGRIVGTSGQDDTKVRVWACRNPIQITYRSVIHVNEIVEGEFEDHGSVEGRLQMVSERRQPHFVIYKRLWDRAIRCNIPEHLLDTAIDNFRKRVEVYDTIKYRRDGKPVSVNVESIEPALPADGAPSFQSVRGILRNYQ